MGLQAEKSFPGQTFLKEEGGATHGGSRLLSVS